MVTDYCAGGELFFHLKKMRRLSEGMMKFYTAELCMALHHLHSHNVIYRDMKPENVLLDRFGHVKLTDFGLSKVLHPYVAEDGTKKFKQAKTFCGTVSANNIIFSFIVAMFTVLRYVPCDILFSLNIWLPS